MERLGGGNPTWVTRLDKPRVMRVSSEFELEQQVQGWKHQELLKRKSVEEAAGASPGVFRIHVGRWTPINQRTRPETAGVSTHQEKKIDRRQQHTTSREPQPRGRHPRACGASVCTARGGNGRPHRRADEGIHGATGPQPC